MNIDQPGNMQNIIAFIDKSHLDIWQVFKN